MMVEARCPNEYFPHDNEDKYDDGRKIKQQKQQGEEGGGEARGEGKRKRRREGRRRGSQEKGKGDREEKGKGTEITCSS